MVGRSVCGVYVQGMRVPRAPASYQKISSVLLATTVLLPVLGAILALLGRMHRREASNTLANACSV